VSLDGQRLTFTTTTLVGLHFIRFMPAFIPDIEGRSIRVDNVAERLDWKMCLLDTL